MSEPLEKKTATMGVNEAIDGMDEMEQEKQPENSHDHHVGTGVLTVSVSEGRDLTGRKCIGRYHAYTRLTYGDQTRKTNPSTKAGPSPTWNKKFIFHSRTANSNPLSVQVFDRNTVKRDYMMGETSLSLADCASNKIPGGWTISRWYPLQSDGKKSGEVKLTLKFEDKTAEAMLRDMDDDNDSGRQEPTHKVGLCWALALGLVGVCGTLFYDTGAFCFGSYALTLCDCLPGEDEGNEEPDEDEGKA